MGKKVYHKKYLADGTSNPAYKPDTRKRENHKSGKRLAKFDRGEFVSWDGEGITREDGKHVYSLLANSRGEYIVNPDGLGTWECLDFICRMGVRYAKSIHVGFVFSYDTAMILFADMNYETVKAIYEDKSPYGVQWGEFVISYRNRKTLSIQRIDTELSWKYKKVKGEWKKRKNVIESCVLWDVFGFFQSSFVEAIEGWLGKDYHSLQMIKEGKLHRGTFTANEIEKFILPYCLAEVAALDELMSLLHQCLIEADIKLSRWDGAGAVAAALLKKYGIKEHIADLPDKVQLAAQHAYFGGRIELCKYGRYSGTVYHYDINSAYPSVQKDCPSLKNGRWRRVSMDKRRSDFSLCRVEWDLSCAENEEDATWSLYPFPFREENGNVIFPYCGSGWYWWPETEAALDELSTYRQRYPQAYIKVTTVYEFVEGDNTNRPFQFIDELFTIRRQWKKEGRKAEKVLKLGINSLYGKTAQSLGYDPEKDRIPPYHSLAWAGYITSATRAKLYSACMQAPASTLMLATDGVFSLSPLSLPMSNKLGDWENETHEEIVAVQSGVYFIRTADKWDIFCRGFDKGTLNQDTILEAWRDRHSVAYFPSTRFSSLGTSCTSKKAWERRGKWVEMADKKSGTKGRKLSLYTDRTKRREPLTGNFRPQWTKLDTNNPADGLINTFAAFNFRGAKSVSTRYMLPWERDWTTDEIDGLSVDMIDDEHMESEC